MLEFLEKNWRYLGVFFAFVLLAILSNDFRSRDAAEGILAAGKLSDAYRSQISEKMKGECVTKIRADPGTVGPGFSPEKVTQYCQCFADRMANQVTADEVKYINANKTAPSKFIADGAQARLYCQMIPIPPGPPMPAGLFAP